MRVLIGVVLAVVLGGAQEGATPPPPSQDKCRVQSDAIADAVKEMSYLRAQNVVERTRGRQEAREQQIATLQTTVQTRMLVMGSTCPPYDGPLDPAAYVSSAMQCVDALTYGRSTTSRGTFSVEQVCDRATWVPREGAN